MSLLKSIYTFFRKRNDKIKVESEISKMKEMLDSINVNEKIDYDEKNIPRQRKS